MKKMLLAIMSGIIATIIALSVLLVINKVFFDFSHTVTEAAQEVFEEEIEVLLAGNSTVSELKGMQETLKGLTDRIGEIFN